MVAPDEFGKIFNSSMYTSKIQKSGSMPNLKIANVRVKDYRSETKKLVKNLFFAASPSKEVFELTKR